MQITILGVGKLGQNIAQNLATSGHQITIIDSDADVISKMESRLDIRCINSNAEDIRLLKSLKLSNCDLVIACTDSDDRNMVLASITKQLGAKRCFARVRSIQKYDDMAIVKRSMKIDYLLNPDNVCANEIYKHLTEAKGNSEGFQTIHGIAIIEFGISKLPQLVNKALKDVAADLDGLLVAAISRNGKIIIPNGSTVLQEDDDIYAVGSREDVKRMTRHVVTNNPYKEMNNVMIAGGGRTGIYLARQLSADGIKVKIVEHNKDRAHYLASELDRASIIFGDASDTELLFEEDLDSMDAFIACTNLDEENFLLGMYAARQGVKNVVSKVTRSNYGSMLESMGEVMTINPVELCTSNVLKQIQNDTSVVFTKLIQGQAEFMEIEVDDDMPIAGKVLMELEIPEGTIIAGIFRNGELVVPRGNTRIESSDKLIVFTLLSKLSNVNKFFLGGKSEEF